LGLPDQDLLVRGTDPILAFSQEGVEWTEIMLSTKKFEHKTLAKIKFLTADT
jgi:hypothetical protein